MRRWIVLATLGVGLEASAQPIASRVASEADRTLLTRMLAIEDARVRPGASDPREAGLTAANPYIRAFTVRGLGRLEESEAFPQLYRALRDGSAEVRAAAADAMAQSVARPLAPNAADTARSRLAGQVARVRDELVSHLALELDPAARASVLESVGRLPQGSAAQVKATANTIAPSLAARSVLERRGAIRGLFFLARKREARSPGVIPAEVTDSLYAMLDEPASAGFTPTDRFNIAYTLWGAAALSDQRAGRLFADRETFVRERGVVNLARSTDLPLIRAVLEKALGDPAPVIRFRSIAVYAQKLRASDGCAPLVKGSADPDVTVALAAIDALSGCRSDPAVAARLRTLAQGLRDDGGWHVPAHAFVSLSVVDSAAARELMPRYMQSPDIFVRMYADTAARLMRDVATLSVLSRDVHANVQASAIAGLSRLVGHAADSIYVRALASDDNQVLMAAAAALEGSRAVGLAAIRGAWDRRHARGWDTDVDGQRALLALYRSLGGDASDSSIVARAPMIAPAFDDLAALERATVRIEMADGGVATMQLHPFDAPTNAFRFARLVQAGAFDGLTFHRVAPFFVVQGPSPNANEYSAPDKPFARDELALSNVRGTVGLSTRGRDTGDGQIYVNTVDNVWLDHEYTVMGTITSGMDVFDRMQEGARIRRVTITP